ncbi:MaoC family dehydratase [Paracraurococcus lichenis]|uniref:MaoC family dehydratase n=1 Tax=Paracraurococcus lichenis TaxID=3064888 RepID=A0ABT9DVY5_9PROT|nr:MaoC family dehydratase [Paracraurococcus sp. LOR1-02]MDO9708065.1 MaoC family dehydratase [Paracraurococcus sp. LOR1-02]
MDRMYLEDFAAGQVFRSPTYAVTEAEVLDYARRYDPQPFHLDHEAAKGTLFGGLAASGWHTAAMTMRLIVDSEFRPAWGVIGGRMERLEWPRPVRPGDVLHVVTEVLEVIPSRSKPGQGMLRVQCTTCNQRDEPVQVIVPNIIVPRRPG